MLSKVILITGTNSGFGWLTAQTLAAAGHRVYATIRESKTRNKEKADILSAIPNITVLDVEISDTQSVNDAIKYIIDTEGRLDVVVNNAGYFAGGPAETFTVNDFENMFNVHLYGTWRVIKAALPHMRERRQGLIVNTSSVLGRFALPMMAIYNSTKAALEGLTESLHYELRTLGIDAVLVQPGPFPTEVGGKASFGSDQSVTGDYETLTNGLNELLVNQTNMFETVKPDPQDVADAIKRLVDTNAGQRPLRTVVDPATGAFTEKVNQSLAALYAEFAPAFGMPKYLLPMS